MDQTDIANYIAQNWATKPDIALFELQCCLHSLAGCASSDSPKTPKDALDMSNGCAVGRWYSEGNEPSLTILPNVWQLIHGVGQALARNDLLESSGSKAVIAFLCKAACWPLVSGRQAAIYIALYLVTGMSTEEFFREDSRYLRREAVIKLVLDKCCMGFINLPTVPAVPYTPPVVQMRDPVIRTRSMILAMISEWLKSRPTFYFPLCQNLLVMAITDRVGIIALNGITALIDILPRISEFDGTFIVSFAWMEEVKGDLLSRIHNAGPANRISVAAKTAITDFVQSRLSHGISGCQMDEWVECLTALGA